MGSERIPSAIVRYKPLSRVAFHIFDMCNSDKSDNNSTHELNNYKTACVAQFRSVLCLTLDQSQQSANLNVSLIGSMKQIDSVSLVICVAFN